MRRLAALAAMLAAACGSTRPLEVPPPYDESGILVTVKPRAYVGWALGFETIRGTAENRTGHDVDLRLYLNLVDEKGAVAGYASAFKEDFQRDAKWKFEASVARGPAALFNLGLGEPPRYTRVTRGFAFNDDSPVGFLVWSLALHQLNTHLRPTRPTPPAARPDARAPGS